MNKEEKIKEIKETLKETCESIIRFEEDGDVKITPEILRHIEESFKQALLRFRPEENFEIECRQDEVDPSKVKMTFKALTPLAETIIEEMREMENNKNEWYIK